MAFGRFEFEGQVDDLPIDEWMNDRNSAVAQRDAFDAVGRERWDASTRAGDYLDASRPSDVGALGGAPNYVVSDSRSPMSTTDDLALRQSFLRGEDAEASDMSPSALQFAGYASPAVGGTTLARGISKKDECIRRCTPLLERYQPPGSDKNRWDFRKCVNQCMEGDGKTSPAPLPSTPSPTPPARGRLPWRLMIPRLVPELPLVPV